VVEEFYPATADEGLMDNSSVVSKLRKDLGFAKSVPG